MRHVKVGTRGQALQAEPNVIPFIDVLLVLLVIFMVTAPQPTVDLRLELPGQNPVHIELPTIIVDVFAGAGGPSALVNGRETPWDALPGAVLRAGLNDGATMDAEAVLDEAHVLVRADQNVAYAFVVSAIDDLQSAGFAKVSLFAQEAEGA